MPRSWLWIGAAIVGVAVLALPSLGIGGGQILAFLVLLLCPLMHLFGGHRHGGGGAGRPGLSKADERAVRAPDGQ